MVDFFFVLSGFVIAASYGGMASIADWLRFLRRRIARLYPLHIATMLVFVALAIAVGKGWMRANHPDVLSFDTLADNLLMTQAWGQASHLSFNGVSWSISAEWFCYLLFPVLLFAARRMPAGVSLALAVGFVAAMSALRGAYGLRPWIEATFDYGAMRALPSFFAGIVLAQLVGRCPNVFRMSWAGIYGLFLLSLAVLHLGLPGEVAIVLLALLVACAAATERADPDSAMTSRLMGHLGDASYSLYMLHIIAAIPVLFALRKLGLIATPAATFVALATYVATVVASCMSYVWFEAPMRQILSGATRGRRSQGTAEAA
jgi:peptidoglycan/LPS O-acetylase OafA/YrhL